MNSAKLNEHKMNTQKISCFYKITMNNPKRKFKK